MDHIFTSNGHFIPAHLINPTFFYFNECLLQIASCFTEDVLELFLKAIYSIIENCYSALKIPELLNMLHNLANIITFKRMSSMNFQRLYKLLISVFSGLRWKRSRATSLVLSDFIRESVNNMIDMSYDVNA
jgi:hypothetical protein